jgi:hypothetical protein
MQQAEKPATIAIRTLIKRDVELNIVLTARAHFGFKKEFTIIERANEDIVISTLESVDRAALRSAEGRPIS